jgi:hypothetical protein
VTAAGGVWPAGEAQRPAAAGRRQLHDLRRRLPGPSVRLPRQTPAAAPERPVLSRPWPDVTSRAWRGGAAWPTAPVRTDLVRTGESVGYRDVVAGCRTACPASTPRAASTARASSAGRNRVEDVPLAGRINRIRQYYFDAAPQVARTCLTITGALYTFIIHEHPLMPRGSLQRGRPCAAAALRSVRCRDSTFGASPQAAGPAAAIARVRRR